MNRDFCFSDFTERNYERLLKIALDKYNFIGFDFNQINNTRGKRLLWRHDVDYSLNRAYALSKIEHSLGIRATYFIHLHSVMYSPFEKHQSMLINNIINNGHYIGLHFDHDFYNNLGRNCKFDSMLDAAVFEREMLQNIFDINVNCVSFHNPEASNVLDLDEDYYAGMVNAYAKTIKQEFKYCSDSNGYWRFDRLEDVLVGDFNNIQVLTHPVWWTEEVLSPYDRIKRCVDGRKNRNIIEYNEFLEKCGRKNVGKPE